MFSRIVQDLLQPFPPVTVRKMSIYPVVLGIMMPLDVCPLPADCTGPPLME